MRSGNLDALSGWACSCASENGPTIAIGIGAVSFLTVPSHTTRHAGPHRAVRGVEVSLHPFWSIAGGRLHRCPDQAGFHPALHWTAPLARASDAMPPTSTGGGCSSSFGPSRWPLPEPPLLRPLLTSRAGSKPSPFRAQGEISPGKNAFLHCATAGSTPLLLGRKSFAVSGPLALIGSASYPVLVHRPAAALHASSPHSVALMQLRFASLAPTSSWRDFHPQERAHAGRTKKTPARAAPAFENPEGARFYSSPSSSCGAAVAAAGCGGVGRRSW